MQTNNTLDLTADVIDVRDIIERYEALEDAADGLRADAEERCQLAAILDELKGNGGDEKWRGDWYPRLIAIPILKTTPANCWKIAAPSLATCRGCCIDWETDRSQLPRRLHHHRYRWRYLLVPIREA
jgi:hypothetical protein